MERFASVMWKMAALLVMALAQLMVAHGELHRGGPGGRFLVKSDDDVAAASGRRVLNGNTCGRGAWPNFSCRTILWRARQPRCCETDSGRFRRCKDVGDQDDFNCGACNNRCRVRLDCCYGRCVNKESDRNNCGRCGTRCRGNLPCQRGQCGYNGRDNDDDDDDDDD